MAIAKDEIFGPVVSVLPFKGDRRSHRAGQQHALRPGRRRLDQGHRQGPPLRQEGQGGHGLGQLLPRRRHDHPVRRLQDVRPGPRERRGGARALHRAQDGDGQAGLITRRRAAERIVREGEPLSSRSPGSARTELTPEQSARMGLNSERIGRRFRSVPRGRRSDGAEAGPARGEPRADPRAARARRPAAVRTWSSSRSVPCPVMASRAARRAWRMPSRSTASEVREVVAACARHRCYCIFGLLERDGSRLFNACVLTGPDGVVGSLSQGPPAVPGDRHVRRPRRPAVRRPRRGRASRSGCTSATTARFPRRPASCRLLGADLLVLPTNWPTHSECAAEHMIPTRAMENTVYVMAVNRVGEESGFRFIGASSIVDPERPRAGAGGCRTDEVHAQPRSTRPGHGRSTWSAFPGRHEIDRIATAGRGSTKSWSSPTGETEAPASVRRQRAGLGNADRRMAAGAKGVAGPGPGSVPRQARSGSGGQRRWDLHGRRADAGLTCGSTGAGIFAACALRDLGLRRRGDPPLAAGRAEPAPAGEGRGPDASPGPPGTRAARRSYWPVDGQQITEVSVADRFALVDRSGVGGPPSSSRPPPGSCPGWSGSSASSGASFIAVRRVPARRRSIVPGDNSYTPRHSRPSHPWAELQGPLIMRLGLGKSPEPIEGAPIRRCARASSAAGTAPRLCSRRP